MSDPNGKKLAFVENETNLLGGSVSVFIRVFLEDCCFLQSRLCEMFCRIFLLFCVELTNLICVLELRIMNCRLG